MGAWVLKWRLVVENLKNRLYVFSVNKCCFRALQIVNWTLFSLKKLWNNNANGKKETNFIRSQVIPEFHVRKKAFEMLNCFLFSASWSTERSNFFLKNQIFCFCTGQKSFLTICSSGVFYQLSLLGNTQTQPSPLVVPWNLFSHQSQQECLPHLWIITLSNRFHQIQRSSSESKNSGPFRYETFLELISSGLEPVRVYLL